MNWLLLARLLGLLGMLVGGAMTLSLPWAFPFAGQVEHFEENGFWGLVGAIIFALVVGGSLHFIGRKNRGTVLRKEALAIVGLGWILSGLLGALPFLFAGVQRAPGVPMNVADALFESISGFTTTGASVLTELEDPELGPRCVLFWRCFTHWLGGMGIIVLFVAVLSHLGAGGKALLRREVPGPIAESVRPRVQETAMVMWAIYVGLSGIEALLLLMQGLSLYDALCHTFGTMATGGFSTYNASVGEFGGGTVEATIVFFMLLAGTNFSLYYAILRRPEPGRGILHRLAPVWRDPEFRAYLGIIGLASLLLSLSLVRTGIYEDAGVAVRHAVFMSISIMTTTGFGTEDFNEWSEFAKGLLLLLMFVGGCAGSTGGGIKVVRFLIFIKAIRFEVERAFRPNVVRTIRLGGVPLDNSIRHDVIVYFSLVLFVFITSWMALAAIEPDAQWHATNGDVNAAKLLDCASAVAATLNNIGPGLGVLGPAENYSDFSVPGKLLLTLLMLLGRLELFAILVLFMPSFWRTQ
ncbi:MAG: TrkH family potassium uptake protein [Maioricimonas sp. JB049]